MTPDGRILIRWIGPSPQDTEQDDARAAILDEEERRRWRRFLRPGDRQLFLTAHLLQRRMLSQMVAAPPEDWRFGSEPNGKPTIIEPESGRHLHVSLSHTEGLAIAAVTALGPIGIDVEPRTRRIDAAVLRRVMTAREQDRIAERGPEEAVRLWTRKEAYAKAIGLGLGLDFSAIDVSDAASLGLPDWCLDSLAATADHCVALAYKRQDGATIVFDAGAWPSTP